MTVLVSISSSAEFVYFSRDGNTDACLLEPACEFEIL